MTESKQFIFEKLIAERECSGPPVQILDNLVLYAAVTEAKRKPTNRLGEVTRHVETLASIFTDDEAWQNKCNHWLNVLEELRKAVGS